MNLAWQHFIQYKPLLYELVARDLKVKYRRSFLGYVWSLLNPLLMMCVMTLVFSYVFRFDIPNYPLYLITGQTLWTFFNESTNMSMYSVLQNGALIKKVYIPGQPCAIQFRYHEFQSNSYFDCYGWDAIAFLLDDSVVSYTIVSIIAFFYGRRHDPFCIERLFSGHYTLVQRIDIGMDVYDADFLPGERSSRKHPAYHSGESDLCVYHFLSRGSVVWNYANSVYVVAVYCSEPFGFDPWISGIQKNAA